MVFRESLFYDLSYPASAAHGIKRFRRTWLTSVTRILCQLPFLLVVHAQQQPAVRIEVTSEGKPVEKARVTINGVALNTDSSGTAVLSPVRPGAAEIQVEKQGYLTEKASVSLEAGDSRVQIELRPAEAEGEEITVYATRSDKRLQDLAIRVEVLTREEIEEKMMMTPGDIVMMLNETGGLRVQTTSPSLGAASVRIQGMRGRYTRFLSDGLPLFGQQGAGLGLLQIPPMDLGQVEVIKGTASALYGSGAMAGLVNLISRRPESEPTREFLVNRSSLGANDGTAFLASRLSDAWSGSVLAGVHHQNKRDIDDDGWADLAGYIRGIVRPRFFWDNGRGHSGFLTGGVTYEDRTGGTIRPVLSLPLDPAARGAYVEALETKRLDAGGSFQSTIGGRYLLMSRFAASSQRHRHTFGETLERDEHQMLFGEMSLRGSVSRHTWVVGLAAERDAYDPRDVARFAYQFGTVGLFIQDDFDVLSWLSVSASARVDRHSRYGSFLSPRLSLLMRSDGWTTRVSAGLGFFAPTPLTEETEAAGLSRLTVLEPLVAERGGSASFDVTRTIGPVSITSSVFVSRIRRPVQVDRSNYALYNSPQPAETAGFEFLGTLRKAPFAATATYTYVRARESESGVRFDLPLTPRHSFGLVGMWEKEDTGRIGIECYYTGQQRLEENPYRSKSKAYTVFGLLAERRVGPARLFINAENISNIRQTRWDPLLRRTRGADGRIAVDAWAPLDGRSVNGGIRFRF